MTVAECPPVTTQRDVDDRALLPRGLWGEAAPSMRSASAGQPAVRGRDAERRTIRDLLLRATKGHGGVVLVEGEPGIGKSLLLRESVNEAAEYGFSLAAGPADRIAQSIPFFTLRRALGEPFGRFIAGLSGADPLSEHVRPAAPTWWIDQARTHLAERAATTPVLVCLDDLQWACPATLAAVWTLPQELKRHPVAWVLAASSAQREEYGYLFELLEQDGATRITLGPLAADGVAEMLADAFGAPPDQGLRTLAAGATGNPWLLAELIDGLRDDDAVRVSEGLATLASDRLPRRMRGAARRRLDGLSKQARQLLTTAAVLGLSFRLEDAAEMLGETPAMLLPAVEETMSAGITAADENGFSFRHQLLRCAVSDMIPPPGRKALHRQYGQILLGRGECPVAAADHLMHAAGTDSPASLAELDAAAERTLPWAPQTAADVASYALELTSPGDPDALTRAVAAAEALAAAGRLGQAGSIARGTLAKPVPPADELRLRCALSSVLYASGETEDAAAEAGTVLARPELPDGLRDVALTAHLQALAGLRDQRAHALAGTVLAAPQQHDGHVVAAAMVARASVAWDQGRVGEALELLRDAARRPGAVSPDARQPQPLLALAAALVDLRQFDEAEPVLAAAEEQALRFTLAQAAASLLRARILLAGGRLDDAAAAAERALAVADGLGAPAHAWAARCLLSVIALRRGDVAAAAQHVASGPLPGPHVGDAYARAELATAQAQVSEARSGTAEAVAHLRQAGGDIEAHPGLLLGDPASAAWMARTALAADDTALAGAVARAVAALAAASPGHRAVTAAAAHCLGLVGRDPSRLAEAAAEHPDPWAQASAAEDLGVLHAARRDQDEAIARLTQAVRGYDLAGSPADAARVRRRLRNLGVRRRHWTQSANRPATGWESLTEAERTASALVAQGLNNRQVADRMYVSIHTVAFYMRQAFRKLSIGSRVELARIVIEQNASAAR
jgi:DNA-binding CsgD family transcriptional regulator